MVFPLREQTSQGSVAGTWGDKNATLHKSQACESIVEGAPSAMLSRQNKQIFWIAVYQNGNPLDIANKP